jgi:hypothetical protein
MVVWTGLRLRFFLFSSAGLLGRKVCGIFLCVWFSMFYSTLSGCGGGFFFLLGGSALEAKWDMPLNGGGRRFETYRIFAHELLIHQERCVIPNSQTFWCRGFRPFVI